MELGWKSRRRLTSAAGAANSLSTPAALERRVASAACDLVLRDLPSAT